MMRPVRRLVKLVVGSPSCYHKAPHAGRKVRRRGGAGRDELNIPLKTESPGQRFGVLRTVPGMVTVDQTRSSQRFGVTNRRSVERKRKRGMRIRRQETRAGPGRALLRPAGTRRAKTARDDVGRSDEVDEFVEYCADSKVLVVGFGAEFVVSSAEVLDECVATNHNRCRSIGFRPRIGFNRYFSRPWSHSTRLLA